MKNHPHAHILWVLCLFQNTRLISRDHVFDVYEGIGSTSFLQDLQGLLNQVTDVLMVSLVVVNAIPCVQVVVFEYVEYGQELSEMHSRPGSTFCYLSIHLSFLLWLWTIFECK